MKKIFSKPVKVLTAVSGGIVVASLLYNTGCSTGSGVGDSSLCNVPLEASLSSVERIGGATTSVALFSSDGSEWSLFNTANELHATPVGLTKGVDFKLEVEGYIHNIEIVTVGDKQYALLAMGTDGITAVDVTTPASMAIVANVKVNYHQEGIAWTEGGGDVVPDNIIETTRAPISSLAVYNEGTVEEPSLQLLIGDEGYGLHKTALSNLFDATAGREEDGTLKIDSETYTLQYAGENPWGGPKSLTLHGEGSSARLFVAQGFLGMGVFDPVTLAQVGRYNLYTDVTGDNGGEDWFLDMNVNTEVQAGFLDSCTGMPDYNQASFEIKEVWHGDTVAPVPWADFDRYGKHYYGARKVDVVTFGDTTMAYIASGLGGMIAVDVTDYDTAIAREPVTCALIAPDLGAGETAFLEAKYLGYVPAAPAHGPDAPTGEESQSLFPYFGVGMLKEAGVVDVKVDTANNKVYYTDHFTGLMVLDSADDQSKWHGDSAPYNNDTMPAELHWPDYEFVTSYDMTPILVPPSEETVPAFIYESPILLATGEVNGHGNVLALTGGFDPATPDTVDVVFASGAGGLNFVDVNMEADPKFTVPVHFATTDEIGAAADGSATQEINIGHSEGVAAYGSALFLGDGPHGMSVWKIADENCIPTDDVHLVANTLQSEYPVTVDGTVINPAPHAYDVVLDVANQSALVMSQSRGLRRISSIADGEVGGPALLYPKNTDIFEHNIDSGNVVEFLKMQDHTYGTVLKGSLAFTADGSNGLTVYDLSKDPTNPTSGYIVSNIGGDTNSQPDLGHATGVALWENAATGKTYAFVAAGHAGIGVVDVTDPVNMVLVKVFEPIKMEDDHVGKADGRSVAVKVVGNHAYFTYDSFGIVAYSATDLIAPLIEGTLPTKIWEQGGLDQRPIFVARFKLQDPTMFGSAELVGWDGGATGLDIVQIDGRTLFYVAYGDAGVIKIDWTIPAAPVLLQHVNTVGAALDVTVVNGRAYVADGAGGLALLR